MDTPGVGIDMAGLMAAFKVLAAVILAFALMGVAAVLALAVQEAQRPVGERDRRRRKRRAPARAPALPVATPSLRGRFQS